MDYIFIKQHLDQDIKAQRFIHNRILYQTSDTTQYANFKKQMNQSYDQSIRQKAMKKNYDISCVLLFEKLKTPQKTKFTKPFQATQKSPFYIKTHSNRYSQAVKNIQRKKKSSTNIRNDYQLESKRRMSLVESNTQNIKQNKINIKTNEQLINQQKYNELSFFAQENNQMRKKTSITQQTEHRSTLKSQAINNFKQKIKISNCKRCKTAEQPQKRLQTAQSENYKQNQNQSFEITIPQTINKTNEAFLLNQEKSLQSQKSNNQRPFSSSDRYSNNPKFLQTFNTYSNMSPIKNIRQQSLNMETLDVNIQI